MNTPDVVIAGAGIIGLSAGLELARAGYRVTVLERGQAMRESSWAAAGMLAAEDPHNPAELAAFSALSLREYPGYLEKVQRLSGVRVPLRTRSTLQILRLGEQCEETPTRMRISPREASARIEGLEPRAASLCWLKEDSLDPRDLCAALPLAAHAASVTLRENAEVLGIRTAEGAVVVDTTAGSLSAGIFINCCGAWSGEAWAGGVSPGGAWPGAAGDVFSETESGREGGRAQLRAIEPRKGQMATVRLQEAHRLTSVIRTPEVYLVPRGDGRVVVGATVERVGFERSTEPAALRSLIARAAEMWPPILTGELGDSWAGLRPGTVDDLPLLGRLECPNCWIATGHFRNGILLAPATALLLREMIEGRPPSIPVEAFRPERAHALPLSDNAFSAAL